MNHPARVSQQVITDALRSLGVANDASLVVHSSLSRFGYVDGGANTVIQALLDTAGPKGHVMMPTFTDKTPRFNPRSEPSQTGRISDVFWRWPGVVRSWHPTHSVALSGPNAAEIVAGHELMAGQGIGSPMDKIAKMGGEVLLLGVDLRACSLIHTGEVYAYAPFLGLPSYAGALTEADVLIPGHGWLHVRFSLTHGCSLGFHKLEPYLRQTREIRETQIGAATAMLINAQHLIETTVTVLEQDPAALLCDRPRCFFCDAARQAIAEKSVPQV